MKFGGRCVVGSPSWGELEGRSGSGYDHCPLYKNMELQKQK